MALTPHVFDEKTDRIVAVTLDPYTITSIDPDEVHEWRVAIYDLVEETGSIPRASRRSGPTRCTSRSSATTSCSTCAIPRPTSRSPRTICRSPRSAA